jgi:integrase
MRGDARLYQRESDGLWVGSVSLGIDGNGKRLRRTVYGKTKADVAKKVRAIQSAADTGRLVETDRLTTSEFLTRWLHNTAKPKTQEGTWERYREVTDLFLVPILGRVPITKLTALHVEQCYAAMDAGAADRKTASKWTQKMAGVVLSQALKHAVKLKIIPFNPASDVAKPKPRSREMVFMTEAQGRTFLAAARSSRWYPLFALALGTGMRQGELLGLSWGDVDFDKGTVEVKRSLSQVKAQFKLKEPKSKNGRRTIVVPGFALAVLREHRTAALRSGRITAPVFCTSIGTYISSSNLRRHYRLLIKAANKAEVARTDKVGEAPNLIPAGVRFHDLRHSHASTLIAAAQSVKAVSRRLGHADITITLKVYAHLMPNDDDKLAAAAEAMFA